MRSNLDIYVFLAHNLKRIQCYCSYFSMMKMQEAGMMERWKDEWWSTINSCSASTRSSGAQSLGMDSLAGLFYVYVSIAALSVIVFVSEIFYRRILADKVHTYMSQLKAIYRRKSHMKKNS